MDASRKGGKGNNQLVLVENGGIGSGMVGGKAIPRPIAHLDVLPIGFAETHDGGIARKNAVGFLEDGGNHGKCSVLEKSNRKT